MPVPEYIHIDGYIIQELSKGSEKAFTQLYHKYSPVLYSTILRYVKDEDQADDLLQNVFIKIWEKRADLAQVKSIENWLFILTRNLVLNHLSKLAHDKRLFLTIAANSPVGSFHTQEKIEEREYASVLSEAIGHLPDQQKMVYQLATDEQLSYQEIADRLSLSRLTVKKHLELARKSVRGYLNQRFHPMVVVPVLFFYDFFS